MKKKRFLNTEPGSDVELEFEVEEVDEIYEDDNNDNDDGENKDMNENENENENGNTLRNNSCRGWRVFSALQNLKYTIVTTAPLLEETSMNVSNVKKKPKSKVNLKQITRLE